jgi:hypothetical protein
MGIADRLRKIEHAHSIGDGPCLHQPHLIRYQGFVPSYVPAPVELPPCWCGRPQLAITVCYDYDDPMMASTRSN